MRYFILVLTLTLFTGCGSNDNSSTSSTIIQTNTTEQNAQAAILYERCQPCHGANAELNALGKSDIIAHYTKEDLRNALLAYQAGTRNTKGMGGLMKGQAAPLSDDDITILSDYISRF